MLSRAMEWISALSPSYPFCSGLFFCSFGSNRFDFLILRINEKVSTPTSIVLMAINAVFGLFYCLASSFYNNLHSQGFTGGR